MKVIIKESSVLELITENKLVKLIVTSANGESITIMTDNDVILIKTEARKTNKPTSIITPLIAYTFGKKKK